MELIFQPQNITQALLVAEAHLRVIDRSDMSPIAFVSMAEQVTAGPVMFNRNKITPKELLPGTRLRAGASEIEIVKIEPTKQIVFYRDSRKQVRKTNTSHFIQLANQQGYRRVWGVASFLVSLKKLLRPILAAVPLMWILKWVVGAIRKRPVKFATKLQDTSTGL